MLGAESLPTEVWFCILEHLDTQEIQSLIGVNRFFFDVGMNARYREVDINTEAPKFAQSLDRVLQPQVAKRVKVLTLQVGNTLSGFMRGSSTPGSPSTQGTRGRFKDRVKTLARKVIPESKSDARSTIDGPPRLEGSLIDAVAQLKNVEDFRIVTWAFPEPTQLSTLYAAAWNAFGRKLKRVSICSSLEGHRALIASEPALDELEILELEFSDQVIQSSASSGLVTTDGPRTEDEVLRQIVVPFIQKLSPKVTTFKVRSWANVDLSPFFHQIDLPALQSTLIRLPFNLALRNDPSGLANLLLSSSKSLTKIALRLTPLGLALDPHREAPLCEWLIQTLSDTRCLNQVCDLDICPTNLPGAMDVLRLAINNTTKTLERFTLRDRYLTSEEVISLISMLGAANSLVYLRINIHKLTVEVFDAMAQNLPELQKLWVSIGDADVPGQNPMETFCGDMKTRTYDMWGLWDLTILRGGNELDHETMLIIADSIPSMSSFWGSGHKGPCVD